MHCSWYLSTRGINGRGRHLVDELLGAGDGRSRGVVVIADTSLAGAVDGEQQATYVLPALMAAAARSLVVRMLQLKPYAQLPQSS